MAKGIGLIGNFKGKVGNMVGYKLTASNTGNTQGVRVYQPIVKNPKTSAQAEQRAKLAPINATYRALKMIIDRGNEGLPYGNKSRLAWLKQAFKAEHMPWIEKGMAVAYPVGCQVTKGSLPSMDYTFGEDSMSIICQHAATSVPVNTVGALTTLLEQDYPFLKDGDQITVVNIGDLNGAINVAIKSIILDSTSSESQNLFTAADSALNGGLLNAFFAGLIIVSREGENGEHLRSTETLMIASSYISNAPYDSTSKTAAIESYMSSAAVNADWAEESIQ